MLLGYKMKMQAEFKCIEKMKFCRMEAGSQASRQKKKKKKKNGNSDESWNKGNE